MPASIDRLVSEISQRVRYTEHATHLEIEITLEDDGLVKVNDVPLMGGHWDAPAHVGNLLAHFLIMSQRGDLGGVPRPGVPPPD
jgi:hypothetical protein